MVVLISITKSALETLIPPLMMNSIMVYKLKVAIRLKSVVPQKLDLRRDDSNFLAFAVITTVEVLFSSLLMKL